MRPSVGVLLSVALVLAGCHPSRGGRARAGDLSVAHAVIPAPPSTVEASVFLVISNGGATEATLTGALTPAADSVLLHRLVGGLMQPSAPLTVPAHGFVKLGPGGYHLMLEGLKHPLAVGDTVTVALQFGSGTTLAVRVPVLNYTDAVSELPLR